ncbi:folate-binding protein YgfZ [Pikeienuella piscinae]|uniref:Folate-binding protein YgfZ n=1 Tax=Pikeienuella piscinae TaxID=2748098 RepID=A0A7L5C2X4_9RHOB|nr:folate-binding protein YgfZ [Pikeienuella piscinae]QIE56239.1 folate-binding protein YgfZ [Pikeienuella piscinae]
MNWLIDGRRGVLRLSGPDTVAFMQDLVTCDLSRIESDRLAYGALLTPQGKFLFDFFIWADGDDLLIDVAADRAPALAQRLTLYRLRRKVDLAQTELKCALGWGGDAPKGARPDPRHEALGWRLIDADPQPPEGARPATFADYDALRVAHCVPESGVELIPDETYILEAGFERLHGVDFRKGCYVGQEVTARMKHKTELKKGLVRVRVDGEAAPGTPVEADGKPAGTLFTVADGEGLAHLRFNRATGEMTAGAARLHLLDPVTSEAAR